MKRKVVVFKFFGLKSVFEKLRFQISPMQFCKDWVES